MGRKTRLAPVNLYEGQVWKVEELSLGNRDFWCVRRNSAWDRCSRNETCDFRVERERVRAAPGSGPLAYIPGVRNRHHVTTSLVLSLHSNVGMEPTLLCASST